ncbi:MAG: hypothetical protein GYB41_01635 [Oceanospirillales bacterium]|uniref:Uncharacterized protein n=1 Tax=Marinobacterium halophilum TaxID=267374 RepID=A0A2P8EUV7_9GAMM|nr:hypothetical protein [Marinobacterium halophilum]MBR9827346.1 hypothetical protein [Oceanospirillales bacterium]PSL13257.1 hypothetical protein CLV44_11395 [Marinobacterium halophilum]
MLSTLLAVSLLTAATLGAAWLLSRQTRTQHVPVPVRIDQPTRQRR